MRMFLNFKQISTKDNSYAKMNQVFLVDKWKMERELLKILHSPIWQMTRKLKKRLFKTHVKELWTEKTEDVSLLLGLLTLKLIAITVQELNSTFQTLSTTVHGLNTSLQGIGWNIHGSFQGVNTTLQGIQTTMDKLLYYAEKGVTCTCQRENPDIQRQQRKSYKLGQDIFYQIHQFTTVSCNGSHVGTIQIQSMPWDITVVNNSTVAVTLPDCDRIDIWNINNRQIVKSIQLSTSCFGITTINNKLVVGCDEGLLIIDPQTEEVEKTIDTVDITPVRLCGSGEGIFYTNESHFLYYYSHSNNEITKVKLSSQPSDVTTLQDGSVYVICYDGSVQHVSSDGKKYKQVTTKGLTSFGCFLGISYNPVQKKLVITDDNSITVFNEC
ncbi:unnamed protein product [Mytilus edulis]|uniref:Uncharacterized protein n=1 Tax=Mytilus edulis TaxID=6550 RepID=A0A8S3T963_MYTED|nr:unnamed protein product [Mytilus edulis]